ncbi:MAG: FAD-binding oxidoreductase [Gammaproteobacteria bacterium]|nr:FAD-binding oxidoreductase [Gammaproteobacteria bacterium]
MKRRAFCKSTLAAAMVATIPACGKKLSGEISAVGLTGEELTLEKAAVQELGDSLNGNLLLASDGGYDNARRVWNGMIDKRPALIAACADAADVQNAVTFASERGLLVAVKGGGHSFPGKSVCDGGLMIDLSSMQSVNVNVDDQTAVVGGGALLGHLDTATLPHNLVTTTGIVSHTGVGGFTLGGGMGRTDRKFGLAIDNLLAADLVTADGQLRHVSADENPDLYWAIRGGGGNFGVATSFTYRLHPFDPLSYGGSIVYPFEQAKDVLNFYAEYSDSLPDEANIEPVAFVSPDGVKLIAVETLYAGDHTEAEQVFAPLRAFGQPVVDEIGPLSYQKMQTQYDGAMGHGVLNYLKSGFLPELTPASVDAIVESFDGERVSMVWFQHLGGQTARVAPDATAFAHRNVHSNFGIQGFWTDETESDERIAAIRKHYAAVEPHMYGFYTNLNEDTEKKTWRNYGSNYKRLVEIKTKFDPENLFRLNSNIKPESLS